MDESRDEQAQSGQLWALYDEFRTACLNQKYYGRKLKIYRTLNVWSEVMIALFAGSSGVGGWAVWKNELGATVWAILAAVSFGLATLKPILNFPDKIERYARLHGEYANSFITLKHIVQDVEANRKLGSDDIASFRRVRSVMRELARNDDPKPSPRIVRKLQREVIAEIPTERLWVPGT